MFKRQWNLKRHYTNCYEGTKYIFPGVFHKNQKTIFDKLESLIVYLPETKRYYQTHAVWDMEAVLMKTNRPSTEQLQFLSKHVPVSISVSSNVEGPQWQSGNTRLPPLRPGFDSRHSLKWESW